MMDAAPLIEAVIATERAPRTTTFPCVERERPQRGPARSSLRSVVTSILVDRGREVLFVGTPAALRELQTDREALRNLDGKNVLASRPLAAIARSARAVFQKLFKEGCEDRSVLGVLSLPDVVVARLLDPELRGRLALVIEGVDVSDPDVEFALSGVRALTERTQTLLAVFP